MRLKATIFSALIAVSLLAQDKGDSQVPNDWANHNRYAEANASLTTAPQVVFMGNSITDMWPVRSEAFWKEHPDFCGRGISGQTSTQMLCRFREDVLDLSPKVVVILAGANDVAQNQGYISNPHILSNILSMVDLARAHGMKVAVCSCLPCSGFSWRKDLEPAPILRELNAMIVEAVEDYCDENVRYVDYYPSMANEVGGLPETLSQDGCHPNGDGYAIMERILLESIGDWLE